MELRAFCPICHLPLDNNLVATACNHVFHRDCLTADVLECPTCHSTNVKDACLEIFGLSFSEAPRDPGAAAVARHVADANSTDLTKDINTIRAVVELCTLRQDVKVQRRRVDELREELKAASEKTEQQSQRLRRAQRISEKQAEEIRRMTRELEENQKRHENICGQIDEVRQRDTVLEYWSMLGSRTDEENRSFLSKMVTMVKDPWKLLTEVSRLRDYHRVRLSKLQKEAIALSRSEARVRRELSEQQHAVAELQKKLSRRASSRSGSQLGLEGPPVTKLARLASSPD